MIRSLGSGQKPALLINECQLGVIDPAHTGFPGLAEQVQARGMVPHIAKLAAEFRAKGLPVFHLPVVHRLDYADVTVNTLIMALTVKGGSMKAGSEAAKYHPDLEPEPEDFVVTRTAGLIAFNGTELDTTLRRLKVQTLVLTGVSVNIALTGNSMVATDLGYDVVIPEDCVAASDAESHDFLIKNQLRLLATITSSQEVIDALQ